MKRHFAAILLLALAGSAQAQAVTVTQQFPIVVTITPAVTAIGLSSTSVSTAGPNNANAVVGAVSVVTNPPGGTFTGVVTLGGTDGARFALTNGGKLPSNLTVGAANIAAGNYTITLNVTQ